MLKLTFNLLHGAEISKRLGDRHGENILFEEGTGGVLHVDFNCLFDKVRFKKFFCDEYLT